MFPRSLLSIAVGIIKDQIRFYCIFPICRKSKAKFEIPVCRTDRNLYFLTMRIIIPSEVRNIKGVVGKYS